jgi:hypothetical protein
MKSGNVCYHSVRNLSSNLVSKNIKLKVYRTIMLTVSCGCETWSLTLGNERTLRVFENRVLRRIFGPKSDEVTESGEDYITRSFVICTSHQILFR